ASHARRGLRAATAGRVRRRAARPRVLRRFPREDRGAEARRGALPGRRRPARAGLVGALARRRARRSLPRALQVARAPGWTPRRRARLALRGARAEVRARAGVALGARPGADRLGLRPGAPDDRRGPMGGARAARARAAARPVRARLADAERPRARGGPLRP